MLYSVESKMITYFFLSSIKQENHSGGDAIVSKGEIGDCLYLIVEGLVEILKKVSDSS